MALQKFSGKVVRKEYITPSVFEIDFDIDLPDFNFKAGQFIMVRFIDPDNLEKKLARSYSVLSNPEHKYLTLCVKNVEGGKGTRFFESLNLGDSVNLSGPYGKFVYKTTAPRIPVFISTGTGITPFISIIRSDEFKNNIPEKGICLNGVRSEEEILYAEQFNQIPNFQFVATVSKPSEKWEGFKGRVTHYLESLKDFNWNQADYYLCGNGDMIKDVKTFLQSKEVPKEQIFQEIYFT